MGEISCVYDLDEALRIVAVDAGWSRFAVENAAPELLPPAPLGRPVLSYVADRATAALYERLFQRVLRTGAAAVIPFRCDAPARRRFLELEIARIGADRLRVTSVLLHSEPRVAIAHRPPRAGADPLRMCSFCKRVAAAGEWLEVEAFVVRHRLFEQPAAPQVTHVVCDDCVRLVASQLE